MQSIHVQHIIQIQLYQVVGTGVCIILYCTVVRAGVGTISWVRYILGWRVQHVLPQLTCAIHIIVDMP